MVLAPDRGARGRPAMVPVAAVRARDRDVAFFVVLTGAEPSVRRADLP